MAVTYAEAPEVERIARDLIVEHHSHLADDNVEVRFVFRSEHAERHGTIVMGKARKVSGLAAWLVAQEAKTGDEEGEPFFVIEIARDIWDHLDGPQRSALVDHELAHCRTKTNKDGDLVLYVAEPEVSDFASVVSRHGLWRPNLVEFFRAAKSGQPTLWSELDDDDEDGATVTDFARVG